MDIRRSKSITRRITFTLLLLAVVFSGTIGPLAARPAKATIPVVDPVTGANTTVRNIQDFLKLVVVNGAVVAVINGLNYFAQKIAYDTAVFIASGGKGEGTLFESKSIGAALADTALGAAGEALGTLSDLGFAGFSLCDPTAAPPSLRMNIFLGLAASVGPPPRPRCEWNDIVKNWDEFITSVETGEALRGTFLSFQPGQSELGVAFGSNIKILELAGKRTNEALKELEIGEGFKSLTTSISGGVKTPSQVIKFKAEELAGEGKTARQMSNAQVASAMGAGIAAIPAIAAQTFLNTLASTLLNRIFQEGLFDVKTVTCPGFDLFSNATENFGIQFGSFGSIGNTECALNNPEFAGRGGRAAAQASFADLLTPRILETQQYDALSEFTLCPDQFRTPSNCVLDSQLAAGVRQSSVDRPLTVKEALDQGYLHGDWPLVSPNGADAAKNADPFCFTTGYCYSNLVKLRKARVIPIGWELAAAKATNGSPTLKEVIDRFNDCPTEDSPLPQDHPWCRLIDPNFILKYPVTQCKAKVYGPTLVSTESDLRAQVCVDTPSCIAESEDGSCESGYGYCTREKNIWRLGGDECPGQYSTCATFTARPGGTASGNLSLLSNTVDRSVCTSDNVGCRGYALDQDASEGTGDWLTSGRVFLDRDAGACEERDAGCAELYPRQTVRENLVRNSSFELDDDGDGAADLWDGGAAGRADTFVDSGIYSIRPDGEVSQIIYLEPGHTYTVSAAAARADAAVADTVNVDLTFRRVNGQQISLEGIDTTCDLIDGNESVRLPISPEAAEFERLGCRFTLPDNPLDGSALNSGTLTISDGGELWVDSIQLEEGPVFSTYHEQPYVDSAASYLRLAPDFLGCAGDPATDDPSCGSYSAVCRADEVGCERYTPTDGSPSVPGIVADANRCPAECAGYSTWRQEPSNYDVESFPNYFIPLTATQCTASVAGCSEFTNLDTLAAGGEAREYYSYLRACEKPPAGAVYYTWEGSDTTGFQLKEWRFVDGSPLADRPEEVVGSRPPRLVSDVFADTCTSDIYAAGTNPDCREFYDISGNRSYRPYSRTVVVTEECHPYRITQSSQDVCDATGGDWSANECVYNGFPVESNACTAAENGCRLYTGNAGRNVRQVFFDDFENGKGGWTDAGTAVSAESTVVGEHSLRVDAGTTLEKDVSADSDTPIFEGGTYYLSFWAKGRGNLTARFSGTPPDQPEEYFANASINLGGNWQVYSFGPVLLDRNPMADEQLIIENFADISYIDNIILRQADEAIAVVKNSWITPASCDQTREGAALPQAMLGCSEYNDRQGASQTLTGFDSICRDAAVGCTAFADTRASDSPGRETWNAMCVLDDPATTPTACEVDGKTVCTVGVGVRSCRYNTPDEPLAVTCISSEVAGFNIPCFIDGVFICDASPSLGAVGRACTGIPADTLLVPEDTTRFIVEDERFQCEAAKVGCTDAGLPKQAVCALPDGVDDDDESDACQTSSCDCLVDSTLACRVGANETACRYPLPFREPYPDGTTLSYESTIVQNAPRTYERSLCTLDAVGCEEWSTSGSEGGTAYFKAPDDRLCEYRENVSVDGTEFDGWFREGTNDACDPNFIIGGTYNGIRRNGDFEYQGFAGSCPSNFAGCTEFRDPSDQNAALYPEGKPYYALKNAKLDTTSCNNQVSQKTGCVLFNDTSNALLTSSSELTYTVSAAANYAQTPPVACESGSCGQCQYSQPQEVNDDCKNFRWGGLCQSDAECTAGIPGETATCELLARSPAYLNSYGPPNCVDAVFDDNGTQIGLPAFWALFRGGLNDANTVIKVKQDRVCGEWLACRSRSPVFDSQTGTFKEVCNLIGTCDAVSGSGESIECTHWVTDREELVLTEETYRDRDVSFAGLEYAGYSIPNQFPADSLEQVGVGSFCNKTFDDNGSRKACESEGDCDEGDRCEAQFRLVKVIGTCTADNGEGCSASGGEGTCYSNKCVVSIRGSNDSDSLGQAVPLSITGANRNDNVSSCRAYPEQNSPFPGSVAGPGGSKPVLVSGWKGDPPKPESVVNGFQRAKICEKDQDCECSYIKASYSAGQDRFFNPSENPFEGLCQGGTKDGEICLTNDDCKGTEETDIGTCQRLDRKDRVLGLEGYCLERDLSTPLNGQQFDVVDLQSRACNTWLPVDRLAGSADIYNNFTSAGFNPTGNVYACAVPEVYKTIKTSDLRCVGIDSACESDDYPDCIDQVLDDNRCPAGSIPIIGWCDMAEDDGSDPSLPDTCETGFLEEDECPYKCIPLGSTHTSDRDGFSDVGQSCDAEIVRFSKVQTAEVGFGGIGFGDILRGEEGDPSKKYIDIRDIPNEDPDYKKLSNSRFLDCERSDVPVTNINFSEGYWTDEVYFGCQDVMRVARIGEPPKAVTGKLGNGLVQPPGSTPISVAGVPLIKYIWGSIPTPFGLILGIPDIEKMTDRGTEAPIQIPLCKDGGGGILADPNSTEDLPLCGDGSSSLVPFDDHPVSRPFIDIHVDSGNTGGIADVCDGDDNCRDYGADDPPDFATMIRDRLSQLFTKVYDTFVYRPRSDNGFTPGDYARQDAGLDYSDRAAEMGGGGPVVAAVGECFEASRCLEGAADRMTANGKDSGDVFGGGGQLGVELKFYAYADNDQMPIRQLVVDWGDGTVDGPFPGSYKNHRGFRRGAQGPQSLCDNSNFGTSPDACDDSSPFVYAYTYTCNADANGNGVCPADATSSCTVADGNRDGVNDCVYIPRVQVKDNWGFCNGNQDPNRVDINGNPLPVGCSGGAAGNNCYDASDERGLNECEENADFNRARDEFDDTPYTAFSGRIIVSPR